MAGRLVDGDRISQGIVSKTWLGTAQAVIKNEGVGPWLTSSRVRSSSAMPPLVLTRCCGATRGLASLSCARVCHAVHTADLGAVCCVPGAGHGAVPRGHAHPRRLHSLRGHQ
eukprot:149386-Rhodomonas_salina.1